MLFNAATGHKLDMGGSQFQLIEKRRSVPDLSQVDTRLQPLLERMLQPDPTERPASMADIAAWSLPDGLAAVPTPPPGRPVSAFHINASPGQRKSVRRRDIWFTSLLASIGVFLIGSCVYVFYFFVWSDTGKGPPLPPPKLSQNASLPKSEPTQPARPQEPAEQPGTQAALPKTASPTTKPPANRLESIRSYLDQYNGGDCFLVVPVAMSQNAAILEGFGSSLAPFDAFAQAFRGEQGFNASVGIRQIAQPQCPAIKFVSELHVDRARAPRINLDNVELKGGDVLSGTVENFSNRTIELLLITDNGQVQNLSSMLTPGTDSMSFTIGLQGNRGGCRAPASDGDCLIAHAEIVAKSAAYGC